jgi:hypothetical protein
MDVRQNLAEGKYDNKVEYHYERVPVDEENMTVKQAREHEANEKQKQRQQKQIHREEESRLSALIKSDLELEHGVAGHRNADKLWGLVWEHGHSGGYGDIISYYEDFVVLIQS